LIELQCGTLCTDPEWRAYMKWLRMVIEELRLYRQRPESAKDTHLKTKTRLKICMPMAAMILTAALAVASAQKQVPFKGALQAHDTDTPGSSPDMVVVTTSGTGIGTHVGQFSFAQEATVNLAEGTETGSAHWIAANGDSIDTTIVGSGEPTDMPDVIRITEVNTITGGRGRFMGAHGSFIVERLANAATLVTSGSFHGTITSPGAGN
jgi:hypothetical protein